MNKILIGAIDQSTTATKFCVFNYKGQMVEKTIINHKQITPQQGWLEHDAVEILDNTIKAIQGTMEKLKSKGYSKDDIKSVGITNQRETVVAWNKNTGIPYHNSIVWNDQRTSEIVEKMAQNYGGDRNVYQNITGLPMNTYFSAFKIKWLLENSKNLQQESNTSNIMYGNMNTWILWNLTKGVFATDVTNASRTYLMNLNTLKYEDKILSDFNIMKDQLPEIKSSAEEYGRMEIGELKGIPITAMLGDQQAASLGHGLIEEGNSKNTYGSGCFLLVNQGQMPKYQPKEGLLTTVLFQLGKDANPYYAFEGSIEAGALTVNWARDKMKLFTDFTDLQNQIDQVGDNGGVYFVPSLAGAFSPYWNANASGAIIGLSFFSQKGHILRALLESVAYRTKDVIGAVEKTGIQIDKLNIDGGVTSNDFLMQFQSDLLQKELVKPQIIDSTCLGVSFAAGLASGVYKSVSEIKDLIEIEKTIKPNMSQEHQQKYKQYYMEWQRAVPRAFDWKQKL